MAGLLVMECSGPGNGIPATFLVHWQAYFSELIGYHKTCSLVPVCVRRKL